MNNYKLINKLTGEEHICQKMVVDGWDYYVSDEIIEEGWKGTAYKKDVKGQIFKHFYTTNDWYKDAKKVIATNNPNIDIPQILEKPNETLIHQIAADLGYRMLPDDLEEGIKAGYKESQETHPFSEEDVIEFTEWLVKRLEPKYDCDTTMNFIPQVMIHGEEQVWTKGNEMITRFYTTKELLQLWKEQKPKTIWYE